MHRASRSSLAGKKFRGQVTDSLFSESRSRNGMRRVTEGRCFRAGKECSLLKRCSQAAGCITSQGCRGQAVASGLLSADHLAARDGLATVRAGPAGRNRGFGNLTFADTSHGQQLFAGSALPTLQCYSPLAAGGAGGEAVEHLQVLQKMRQKECSTNDSGFTSTFKTCRVVFAVFACKLLPISSPNPA